MTRRGPRAADYAWQKPNDSRSGKARSLSDIDHSTVADDPRRAASFSSRKNPLCVPGSTPPVCPGRRPRICRVSFASSRTTMADRVLVSMRRKAQGLCCRRVDSTKVSARFSYSYVPPRRNGQTYQSRSLIAIPRLIWLRHPILPIYRSEAPTPSHSCER